MRNDWLLFFHILFALGLVGGVLTVVLVSVAALSQRAHALFLRRIALLTSLWVVIPGFVGVYALGASLADKEFPHTDPHWLSIASGITDVAVIFGGIGLTLMQWWTVRRARAATTAGWQEAVTSWGSVLLLAALAAIVFLMAGKPR
jgi:hypothetical protein